MNKAWTEEQKNNFKEKYDKWVEKYDTEHPLKEQAYIDEIKRMESQYPNEQTVWAVFAIGRRKNLSLLSVEKTKEGAIGLKDAIDKDFIKAYSECFIAESVFNDKRSDPPKDVIDSI
jgi:hypothetical protein